MSSILLKIENKTNLYFKHRLLLGLQHFNFFNYIYMYFHHLCHDAHTHKENITQITKGNLWANSKYVAFKQSGRQNCPNTTELLIMHRITFINIAVFLGINPLYNFYLLIPQVWYLKAGKSMCFTKCFVVLECPL